LLDDDPVMPTHGALGFDGFIALNERQRMKRLLGVCPSPIWARRVLAGGPFPDVDALLDRADRVLAELPDAELDVALDGHPRIGATVDNESSAREQAGVAAADDTVRAELAAGNRQYDGKFGFVYLVCASGRSAEELLAILATRLHNDRETERGVMREELAKINRLRLQRLLSEPHDEADRRHERRW
jgi:2-oxo-4-hydroxy-4-carboxy-5-ureidoimidazoline decarboxylase